MTAGRTPPVEDEATLPFWEVTTRGPPAAGALRAATHLQWPPQGRCRRDPRDAVAWIEAQRRAATSTRSWRSTIARMRIRRRPYVLAIVQLEEGVAMTTNLVDVDPDAVTVGMPVEVRWEPLANGRWLPVFAPRSDA